MRLLLKAASVLIVIAIIVNIAASFVIYNLAIARIQQDSLIQNISLEQAVPVGAEVSLTAETTSITQSSDQIDWFNENTYEEVSITSVDGLTLKGYYLDAKVPTSKTVILAHGYSSKGTYMGSYAKLYYEEFGYNILLPDDRGHGNSEGNFTGFGWIDRIDYLKWIDFVINRLGQDSQIVLHGVSMGGATVLMTSGENIPDNIKAIISDCSYTSVKDELEYQLKKLFNLPAFPLLTTTSIITKLRAGYFFGEASALEQVNKTEIPILFIHGDEDDFVPFHMVFQLYEACNSEKDLLVIPAAGHGTAYETDPFCYMDKVSEFLGKYVK